MMFAALGVGRIGGVPGSAGVAFRVRTRVPAGAALLLALSSAGFLLVVTTLYLGPRHVADGFFPLPFRAISITTSASAILAAAGFLACGSARCRLVSVMFIAFAAPLANTRLISSGDTTSTANLPFVIVREHALTFAELGAEGARYDLVPARNGRRASKYPIGTSILSLPFVMPAALGQAPLDDALSSAAHKIAAAALASLALIFVLLTLRNLSNQRTALLASTILLFGTAWLPVLSQALWQHTGAVLALAVALWSLLGVSPSISASALGGFGIGAAMTCRPADLPLGVALLVGFTLRSGWRDGLLPALSAAAIPLGLDVLYRWEVFGSVFATGYGTEATLGWKPPWPDGVVGLLGLLVSPGRGILLWSPILFPGLVALVWPDRQDPRRRIFSVLGAGVIAHTLLMACWWAWHGGWSPGPRMLSDDLPFLALGLPGVLTWAAATRNRRVAVGTLACWSIAANAMVTYVPSRNAYSLVRETSRGPWSPLAHPFVAYSLGLIDRVGVTF